jgi:alpha-1,2-mannosyltransferase
MISDAVLGRWLPRRSVLLWGDVVRGLLWGGCVLAWALLVPVYVRLWNLTLVEPSRSDFTIFYFTARLVADGLPMYGSSPGRYGVEWPIEHLGNLNPPHFQLLLQPLALFSYEQAYAVWTAINLAALAASVVVIMRTLNIRFTVARVLGGGAVLVGSAPFTTVAITSELTFLLLLPFTLAWAAAVRGHWGTAGAWLGLCASTKLFFLLFIPWLVLRRRWRAVAGMAGSSLVAGAFGVSVYGLQAYRLWVGGLGAVDWWWLPMNASWHGFVSRVFEGGATVAPPLHAPGLVGPLATAGFVLIATLSLVAALRLERAAGGLHAAVLVLVCGAILASPLGWVYYLPLALAPVVGLLRSGEWRVLGRGRRWVAITAAFLLYVPWEQTSAGQPAPLATISITSSYFWGVVFPWAVLVLPGRAQATS